MRGGGGGGAPEVIFHKLEVGEQAAVLLTRTREAEEAAEAAEAVEEAGAGSGEVSLQLLEAAQAVVDRDTGALGDTGEEFPA